MKYDIRNAMKYLTSFLFLIPFTITTVSGQSPSGVLKIFSENPIVVYVNEVHYPKYSEIKLAPGTHWVKAINAEGIRVYSQIVSLKADEVTSVLIEAPQAQTPAAQTPAAQTPATQNPQEQSRQVPAPAGQTEITYGRPAETLPDKTIEGTKPEALTVTAPAQTIDIGQIGGKLPADLSGAYGLSFGMNVTDVDRIMSPKAARTQRNSGYNTYAIRYGSSVYVVECRFIDQKLFQIIVGYPSVYTANAKLKLDKKEVPFPEFNSMLNDITAIYGAPATAEKIFLGGYTEDDGRILEALRKKKALLLYTWIDPATGNNIMVGLGYTTTPLAATIYTSGPMSAEAAARKLRLNSYDYKNSFKDNYFSN